MGVYKRTNHRQNGREGVSWWISYCIDGRQYRERGGDTKAQAEALLAKRKVEVFEGTHFPERRKAGLTVGGLRDLWLEAAAHKRSLDADRLRFDTLVKHLGERVQIVSLAAQDVERLKAALREGKTKRKRAMTPATVNRHLALLKSALRVARANGYHHRDPMAGVKMLPERNERERICGDEELARLVEAAAPRAEPGRHAPPPDLRLAIQLGYWTGMRLGEIATLRWEQLDLRAGLARLSPENTKTGEGRQVPLSAEALEALRAHPRNIDGRVVSVQADALSRGFARLVRELEIQDLRFHDLRHTAATRLRRAGVDLVTIKAILGHRSWQTMGRYQAVDVNDLRGAVAKLEGRA